MAQSGHGTVRAWVKPGQGMGQAHSGQQWPGSARARVKPGQGTGQAQSGYGSGPVRAWAESAV